MSLESILEQGVSVYNLRDPEEIKGVEKDIRKRMNKEKVSGGFLHHAYSEPTLVVPRRWSLEEEREDIEEKGGRIVYRDVGGEVYAHLVSDSGIHTECIYACTPFSSMQDRDENIRELADFVISKGKIQDEGYIVQSNGDIYVSNSPAHIGHEDRQVLGTGSYIFKNKSGERFILTRGCYQVNKINQSTFEDAVRQSENILGIDGDEVLNAVLPVQKSVLGYVKNSSNYAVQERCVDRMHTRSPRSTVFNKTLCVTSRPTHKDITLLGYTR